MYLDSRSFADYSSAIYECSSQEQLAYNSIFTTIKEIKSLLKNFEETTEQFDESDEEAAEEFEQSSEETEAVLDNNFEETTKEPKELLSKEETDELLEKHCRTVTNWVEQYLPHLKGLDENTLIEAKSVVDFLCSSKLGFIVTLFQMAEFVLSLIEHFFQDDHQLNRMLDFLGEILNRRKNNSREIDKEELDKWFRLIGDVSELVIQIDKVESKMKSLKIADLYAKAGEWFLSFCCRTTESCFLKSIKANVKNAEMKATKELYRALGKSRISQDPSYARICFNMSVAHLRLKEYKEADTYCKSAFAAWFKISDCPDDIHPIFTELEKLRADIDMGIMDVQKPVSKPFVKKKTGFNRFLTVYFFF